MMRMMQCQGDAAHYAVCECVWMIQLMIKTDVSVQSW